MAISRVWSVDPQSTTTTSSAHRRLSIARAMLRSSLSVTIAPLIRMKHVSADNRRDGKTKQKHNQRQYSQLHARRSDIRLVVNRRMLPREEEQYHRPEPPAVPELSHRQQGQQKGLRDPLVRPPEQRIHDVASIQLTDRQKIKGCREHPHP